MLWNSCVNFSRRSQTNGRSTMRIRSKIGKRRSRKWPRRIKRIRMIMRVLEHGCSQSSVDYGLLEDRRCWPVEILLRYMSEQHRFLEGKGCSSPDDDHLHISSIFPIQSLFYRLFTRNLETPCQDRISNRPVSQFSPGSSLVKGVKSTY